LQQKIAIIVWLQLD